MAGNVRETDPNDVLGMLAGRIKLTPDTPNVTLCSDWNVHITFPPPGMDTVYGVKTLPVVARTVG